MQGAWVRSLVRKLREENESEEGRDGGSIISNTFLLIESFPSKVCYKFLPESNCCDLPGPETPITHRGLSPTFSFPGWEGRVFSSPEPRVNVRSEVPGYGEAGVLTLFTFLLCDGPLTLFRKVLIKKNDGKKK